MADEMKEPAAESASGAAEESTESGLSECCLKGFTLQGTPKGEEVVIEGITTYVSKAATTPSKRAILVLTDIFGLGVVNNKVIPDAFAAAGFDCYAPDLFNGDPLLVEKMGFMSEPSTGFVGKLYDTVRLVYNGPSLLSWVKKHKPNSPPIAIKIAEYLRSQGYSSIGAVGYCWGAYPVVRLAGVDGEPKVDAIAAAHPSLMEVPGDIEKLVKPCCFLLAEDDSQISKSAAVTFKAAISKLTTPAEADVVPNTMHGFASRGKDQKIVDESLARFINFFDKHLPA